MNRTRRPETEVLSLIDRSSTPPLNGYSGTGSYHDTQPQQVVVVPLQRPFTFDHIFGTGSSQEEVYQGSVKRMVDKFLEGMSSSTTTNKGQTNKQKDTNQHVCIEREMKPHSGLEGCCLYSFFFLVFGSYFTDRTVVNTSFLPLGNTACRNRLQCYDHGLWTNIFRKDLHYGHWSPFL